VPALFYGVSSSGQIKNLWDLTLAGDNVIRPYIMQAGNTRSRNEKIYAQS